MHFLSDRHGNSRCNAHFARMGNWRLWQGEAQDRRERSDLDARRHRYSSRRQRQCRNRPSSKTSSFSAAMPMACCASRSMPGLPALSSEGRWKLADVIVYYRGNEPPKPAGYPDLFGLDEARSRRRALRRSGRNVARPISAISSRMPASASGPSGSTRPGGTSASRCFSRPS